MCILRTMKKGSMPISLTKKLRRRRLSSGERNSCAQIKLFEFIIATTPNFAKALTPLLQNTRMRSVFRGNWAQAAGLARTNVQGTAATGGGIEKARNQYL